MAYSTTHATRDALAADGKLKAVCIANAQAVKKGDIILIKAADGLGYVAYATASSATGDAFAGLAFEDKTAAANTDQVRVTTEGEAVFAHASASQANVGDAVWHDNGTAGNPITVIASAGTHGCPVGVITEIVSATSVRVKYWGFHAVAA